jgi:hypothetical protein
MSESDDVQFRTPDPWKVRWCGVCRHYEFDAGVPRGWVILRGDPPPRDPALMRILDGGE